ncbi:VOC family protein [Eubacteriaceae bacterium ES2]|nr:VOC family protein [Eubacteriaceae bacterium ES2]
MMSSIIHFELCADQPERAVKFYQEVFDWQISNFGGPEDYWLVTTHKENEPGINGAIKKRDQPTETTINTIEVASFDEFAKKIEAAGGTLLMPKQIIPGVGYFAYFKDTEGNLFGMMETIK